MSLEVARPEAIAAADPRGVKVRAHERGFSWHRGCGGAQAGTRVGHSSCWDLRRIRFLLSVPTRLQAELDASRFKFLTSRLPEI